MYNYIEKKKNIYNKWHIYNRGAYNLFLNKGDSYLFNSRQDNKKVNQPTNYHEAMDQTPRQSHKISQGYHQQDCCSPQGDQIEKGDRLPNQSNQINSNSKIIRKKVTKNKREWPMIYCKWRA